MTCGCIYGRKKKKLYSFLQIQVIWDGRGEMEWMANIGISLTICCCFTSHQKVLVEEYYFIFIWHAIFKRPMGNSNNSFRFVEWRRRRRYIVYACILTLFWQAIYWTPEHCYIFKTNEMMKYKVNSQLIYYKMERKIKYA